jgi:hypothetical protein
MSSGVWACSKCGDIVEGDFTSHAIACARLSKQRECSHSFNCEDKCEYCGLSLEEYEESCMDDEPIGTYE